MASFLGEKTIILKEKTMHIGSKVKCHAISAYEKASDCFTTKQILNDAKKEKSISQPNLDSAIMNTNFANFHLNNEALTDTSETISISSFGLLKMMKHGRAGIPLEVMGLMLGEFVDDHNVKVVDVFAMPKSETGVTVEAVDPVFQTKMMDILKATRRHEHVIGWYHSHRGFGCWLSSTDVSTQSDFERLFKRAVALVIEVLHKLTNNSTYL